MSTTNPAPAPTAQQIASAAGPLLVGALVTWLLMGIYMKQAYFYFLTYNDRGFIRGLVIVVTILEFVQWILSTMDSWYYLVTIWGNFGGFFIIPWEAAALVLLCGISSMIVQSFYAWQIWTLGHSRFFNIAAILIEGVSLMQGFTAIAAAAFVLVNPTEGEVARRHVFFSTWLIGSFVTDTLISLCMLYILFRAKNTTPWKKSKVMFNKLIVNTVNTGSATSVVAAVTLALFNIFPNVNYYGTPSNFLQKLYAISLLASLNSRRRSGSDDIDVDGSQSLALNLYPGSRRGRDETLHSNQVIVTPRVTEAGHSRKDLAPPAGHGTVSDASFEYADRKLVVL
ncbi:hypothetical protein MVEN_02448800 [Mycena venus]|uniref:DUF6534 domain-containing protein n=1 Tax=Mycena venus TaxID=2733690 RepID=A0A8H6WYU0_9AGAR|nr:hypothetical protein MVEN_02448800 [Mycena venus]